MKILFYWNQELILTKNKDKTIDKPRCIKIMYCVISKTKQ